MACPDVHERIARQSLLERGIDDPHFKTPDGQRSLALARVFQDISRRMSDGLATYGEQRGWLDVARRIRSR